MYSQDIGVVAKEEGYPTCGAKIAVILFPLVKRPLTHPSPCPPFIHLFRKSIHSFIYVKNVKYMVCFNDSGAKENSSDKIDLPPWGLCFHRVERQQTKPIVCELVLNVMKKNKAEEGNKE